MIFNSFCSEAWFQDERRPPHPDWLSKNEGIVDSHIKAKHAGLPISTNELEKHFLSGGNVEKVVDAAIRIRHRGVDVAFDVITQVDLAGFDVQTVTPEQFSYPTGVGSSMPANAVLLSPRASVENPYLAQAGVDSVGWGCPVARLGTDGVILNFGEAA